MLGAVGAYAYDSSQKDKIAEGVTIAGVDVGGMEAEEAEAGRAHGSCWRRCATRSGSATTARAGSCPARSSRSTPTSTARSKRRSTKAATAACRAASSATSPAASVDEQVSADVTYSQPAVNRFVRQVAEEVDREPQDATVEASGDSNWRSSPPRTAASCATTC